MLHFSGKPEPSRTDPALFELEKMTHLIQIGVYRYIRHPLYSSLLFLAWGVWLKSISLTRACLVLVITTFLALTAKSEEGENIAFFGEVYRQYMKQSKIFIPFLL